MLVVRKKIGEAFRVNGVTVGVVAVRGQKVSLGIQSDDATKRCDLQITAPMPLPKGASTPEQIAKADRDLALAFEVKAMEQINLR